MIFSDHSSGQFLFNKYEMTGSVSSLILVNYSFERPQDRSSAITRTRARMKRNFSQFYFKGRENARIYFSFNMAHKWIIRTI